MLQQNILKVHQVMSVCSRSFGQHNKKHVYKNIGQEGQKYEKLRYYPKNADFVDTPIEHPVKLFRVQRIKPMKGNPYWEKAILKNLGLDKMMRDVTVVKNIPEVNAMLWKVKHLVDIKPIIFPYGEPTMNDINNTFLKESGECIVTKEIAIDENRLLARTEFDERPERLDGATLKRDSTLKWNRPYES